MTNTISAFGISLLKHFEGLRTTAYQDSKGIWTIGYGHTGPDVRPGLIISRTKASELFRHDSAWAQDAVNRAITIDITQNQFDSMVCLAYNIGYAGFLESLVVEETNKRNFLAAAKAFMNWTKSGGKAVLYDRRVLEAALYCHGLPA